MGAVLARLAFNKGVLGRDFVESGLRVMRDFSNAVKNHDHLVASKNPEVGQNLQLSA
jgi:hypothetical protein